ncbi:M14 family metallopeptidase [Sphingomonas canadensis]|uniref:M14 family metallopeptidase n=1 Tax=Sphingomonas canadensis TaxID=1219257 RepID=A0ABW3HA54_9SPHN|nr:M14 family metallopeptidase [Sphingomonas canadensis]MCW3838090.1 M14 family metallopeptidase [Sphingomonas canadensis]
MQWFSETVPQSDALFASMARAAGAAQAWYPHPLPDPDGLEIGTRAAWIGPEDAVRVTVVVSGTHGIEGYAGAAIQSAWLERAGRHWPGREDALLMVHQINPWGCAWNRREDHQHIDVFRNLVYDTAPFRANPLYDRYEEGINPRAWEGLERERADAIFTDLIREHGMEGAITAIRRGQHDHPLGITYHGAGASWSRDTMDAIGERFLRRARTVDVLDIHTGFGDFGQGMIISCETPGTENARWVDERFGPMLYRWGQVGMIPEHPHGPYHRWERVTGPGSVRDFGLEFGTYDMGERFDTFRANHFVHTRGTIDSPFGRSVSAAFREGYYPASEEWRARILATGLDVIDRSIGIEEIVRNG